MKLPEVTKILSKARKRGKLLVSELDAILDEDRFFERNAARLLKSMGEIPVRSEETNSCLDEPVGTGKKRGRSPASTENKDQLYDYLRDINKRLRMTREEEIRYSKRMEFSRQRLIFSIQNITISKEVKTMLLRFKECPGSSIDTSIVPLCSKIGKCPRGKAGFIKDCCACYNTVRSDFVERNLHLVVNITRQYRTYGIPLMDLVQEGNAALIRAVEKYDWRRGVRFQTYATFWVKQAIERCITANKGIVRVPNYLQQKMRRFRRNGILSADKSTLSVKEVSEAFELSSEVAGHLLETGRGYVSLDSPHSEDDENSIADMLAIKEEENIPEGEFQKLKGRLDEALDVLSDQERFIISHRFGLEGKEIKTLDEIGKLMSVSRERIRQLQIRALQKLKRPSLLERLAPFLS